MFYCVISGGRKEGEGGNASSHTPSRVYREMHAERISDASVIISSAPVILSAGKCWTFAFDIMDELLSF